MEEFAHLAAYLLSAMGLTVLMVWPQGGPVAWFRERVLRRWLPATIQGVLDCYVCLGFWCGLVLSPAWWFLFGHAWCWFGCLMTPAAFWIFLRNPSASEGEDG